MLLLLLPLLGLVQNNTIDDKAQNVRRESLGSVVFSLFSSLLRSFHGSLLSYQGLKFGVGAAHVPAAKPAPVVVVPFGQDLAPFHQQRAVLHAHRALGRLLSRHLQIPLDTTHFASSRYAFFLYFFLK
ncbi:hypothetical protein QOT17_022969 [Balamuthia mandrillaris]